MSKEIELKFTIDDAQIGPFEQWVHAHFPESIPNIIHLRNHYYDTADHLLTQKGFALRIRINEGKYFQTLKRNLVIDNGLHQRDEWENTLETDAFDIAQFPKDLQDWLEIIEPKLQCVFKTDFVRKRWLLAPDNETKIELVLDIGNVIAGAKKMKIQEIELELQQGNIDALKTTAQQLSQELNLQAENKSKAERGYALLD